MILVIKIYLIKISIHYYIYFSIQFMNFISFHFEKLIFYENFLIFVNIINFESFFIKNHILGKIINL